MGFSIQCEERSQGRVARLTIDNRKKANSLNSALLGEIVEGMAGLAADPELRLAILTAAGGRAFVGGADVGEIAALDHAAARRFITLVHRCCAAFRHLPVPVIARIEGPALGAGLELAAACDLRVASEASIFGMPEVAIGIPSVVEAALLPRLIGEGRARRLLLTGETIDAAEALSWGLVDMVAPAGELDAAVERLVRPILAAGPSAIRLQKLLIRDWQEVPAEAAIARGIDVFVSAFDSDEPARMAGAALARLAARRARR
ncbi:MAG: enoyl-CoA hydratase [Stellaceae bacterium]